MTDIRKTLDEAPMTSFQWLAVAISTMLTMLDGFDVLVMAFTASAVTAEWQLNGAQLGVLFSAGVLGMALGSLFVAPLADRFGRQPIIVLCLSIVAGGMLASAFAASPLQLTVMRGITGIGIGGMLAGVGVITAEYSSRKWRSSCVTLQATGYPIGATLGGLMAAWLLTHYGWRSVFVFGGLATLAMIPVVLWKLPESVDFLLAHQPARALDKLNRLLRLMGHAAVQQLPARPAGQAGHGSSVSALFSNGLARPTLMLWTAFFLLMFSIYFSLSWTPKLLVQVGLSAQQGVTGGVLLNLGGIVGGSLFGALAVRMKLQRMIVGGLLLHALFTVMFGAAATQLSLAFAAAFGLGVFLFGSMAGLYALVPATYPPAVRATGMGWALGIGRFGAIVAPTTAGVLVDGGWQPASLYYVFALPLVASALAVVAMGAGRSPGAAHPAAAH